MRSLLIGLGGFLGSLLRYWMAGVVQRLNGEEFPWGTLSVNVCGSLVLGLILGVSLDRGLLSPNARLFLAVGLCGGFTTMSTFSYETVALLREGSVSAGLGNVALTLVLCIAAVWLGDLLARVI